MFQSKDASEDGIDLALKKDSPYKRRSMDQMEDAFGRFALAWMSLVAQPRDWVFFLDFFNY